MITFEYRFDIVPGKKEEFMEWTEKVGRPAWLRSKEVLGYRVYNNLFGVGAPQRVVQVDLEDLAALQRLFTSEEFKRIRDEFHRYAINLSESVLTLIFKK